MATTQLKTIIPGVTMRVGKEGRSLRFACMVRGSRFTKTYDEAPVEVLLDCKGRPTRQLKDAYNAWKTSCEEKVGVHSRFGLKEPTLGELLATYEKFATARSMDPRYQRPKPRTIDTALKNIRILMRELELPENAVYSRLFNEDAIKEAFDRLIMRKVAGVSAWTYVMSVKTVTSPWTKTYWEKAGFLVRTVKLPDAGLVKDPPRYQRPTPELIEKQNMFYASLQDLEDKQPFLVASMILHLAMRPEDIGLLTAKNFFRGQDGRMFLTYTPEKTKHTSKRIVTWPVPEALWEQIREYAGARLDAGLTMISSIRYVCESKLNPAMRMFCGMESSTKALYEFRKRCIDYVYHKYGINAAVAISGDNASTIEYYYFDPAMSTMAPTFETVPIKTASVRQQEKSVEEG